MRRGSRWVLVLAAVLAVAFAAAGIAKPTTVQLGNLVVTFDGMVSPKKLPRNKLAPITFTVSGKIKTIDGTHPPALKEFVVEADKNGVVDAKGLPVCARGKLEATDTSHARAACPTSIVGEGVATAEIQFPEQPPIQLKSKLLAFNGGVKGGTTTLFIHAYLSSPVSAAVVTTVKVTRIHRGRYGIKSVASIPVVAGGSGSVKEFSLTFNRSFTYKGKKHAYLSAKCPDGHLNAHGVAIFRDHSLIEGDVVRPCTPTG